MTRHTESVEIVVRDQRRRLWSLAEKAVLVRRTYEPGMSVSLVARQEGGSAGLLLHWPIEPVESKQALGQPCGLSPKPDMHLSVSHYWVAASLKTAGCPFLPVDDAHQCRSASSQAINDPRRLRAKLYSLQLIVRYFGRAGLLMT